MGDKPENSVLNSFCQCWDADNVFVTDGACFISSGFQNHTLTMMALTARACQFIARDYAKSRTECTMGRLPGSTSQSPESSSPPIDCGDGDDHGCPTEGLSNKPSRSWIGDSSTDATHSTRRASIGTASGRWGPGSGNAGTATRS